MSLSDLLSTSYAFEFISCINNEIKNIHLIISKTDSVMYAYACVHPCVHPCVRVCVCVCVMCDSQ